MVPEVFSAGFHTSLQERGSGSHTWGYLFVSKVIRHPQIVEIYQKREIRIGRQNFSSQEAVGGNQTLL